MQKNLYLVCATAVHPAQVFVPGKPELLEHLSLLGFGVGAIEELRPQLGATANWRDDGTFRSDKYGLTVVRVRVETLHDIVAKIAAIG